MANIKKDRPPETTTGKVNQSVLLPIELREQLILAAKENDRNLSGEITSRLKMSFG